jgi:HAD superfamily hydrolase (TIGR01509 family)
MRRVGAKIHYLNFKNPVAIIFDLDGVLVDTNIVHKDSLIKSIKNITGVDASLMISSESMLSTKQKIQNVKSQFGLSDEMCVDVLIEKDRLFLEMIKNIKVDDNVIECLLLIRSRGIRTAIASNSRLININNVLAITGLREYFDVIVSAEEVARPKPMPDILFEVYNRLHIYGNDCIKTLFVEDTDEGARAGEQSMSSVVRVKSPADLTIDKFSKWLN